ncbi:MAG: SDR family oxidoreductase [Planctomycetota bacterium]|jgi:short-subunit dehydrogenase
MKRELAGKRIVITGASSGIGRALAEQLAAKGAKLVLAARSEDKLRELAATLKTETLVVPTDVTKDADRVHLIDAAKAKFGGIDVLINNAGIASWAHFGESSEEVLRQIMEVNFFGPAHLIKLAQPLLTDGQQPAIVNVSSMCGRKAMPGWSEYSASKYALCGLTEALRGEFARYDIDVLLIIPGLTKSSFQEHCLQRKGRAKIEFEKGMEPAYVAGRIIRSLESNKTETVLGSEAWSMLLMSKFFPRLTDWLLARKMKQLYAQA